MNTKLLISPGSVSLRGDFSTGCYPDEWHWRPGISKPDVVREICNAWKSDDEIQKIVLAEEVGYLGGQLFEHWDSSRVGSGFSIIWLWDIVLK